MLMAVAAEPLGEDGTLCGSSLTDGPGGSLCVLIATTYSYVVMPYKRNEDMFILHIVAGVTGGMEETVEEKSFMELTFLISIRWKKNSSPKGTQASKETAVQRA